MGSQGRRSQPWAVVRNPVGVGVGGAVWEGAGEQGPATAGRLLALTGFATKRGGVVGGGGGSGRPALPGCWERGGRCG
jgi:hypothetical protein